MIWQRKSGLAHGGGLHVEQAGIEREEERGDDGSGGAEPVAREAPEAGDAEDVADHGGDGAGDAVLPPGHAGDEGHHEQVREREPDGADLADAGVERVEDAAGDVQVRDGVSVEQEHVAGKAIGEGEDGEQRGDHAGEDGFVTQGAGDVFGTGGRGNGFRAAWPLSRDARAAEERKAFLDLFGLRFCRRSVPKRSTAKEPMTPP